MIIYSNYKRSHNQLKLINKRYLVILRIINKINRNKIQNYRYNKNKLSIRYRNIDVIKHKNKKINIKNYNKRLKKKIFNIIMIQKNFIKVKMNNNSFWSIDQICCNKNMMNQTDFTKIYLKKNEKLLNKL